MDHPRWIDHPRYLLEYLGIEYDERRYNMFIDEHGAMNMEDWLGDKRTLGLDFPNVSRNA